VEDIERRDCLAYPSMLPFSCDLLDINLQREQGLSRPSFVLSEVRMKLRVLVDNNTLTDRPFVGEPALAHFIEAEGKKILFDVRYSDVFVTNAGKLHIDLLDVDFVELSHGHLDHTWGSSPLFGSTRKH